MKRVVFVLVLLTARGALAKQCSNPCRTADGGLCVDVFVPGRGYVGGRVVEKGRLVELRVGRQRGTCGGLEMVRPDEVTLLAASTASAKPTPLAVKPVPGGGFLWKPDAAGPVYLTAQPKQGAADKIVMLVTETVRQVKLVPARAGTLVMRWMAAADAEPAGFARARWPYLVGPLPRGKTEWAVAAPDGDYEMEWSNGTESALLRVQLAADGELAVPVPASLLRLRVKKPQRWVWIEVEVGGGLAIRRCLESAATLALRVPPGNQTVRAHWPKADDTTSTCGPGEGGSNVKMGFQLAVKGKAMRDIKAP